MKHTSKKTAQIKSRVFVCPDSQGQIKIKDSVSFPSSYTERQTATIRRLQPENHHQTFLLTGSFKTHTVACCHMSNAPLSFTLNRICVVVTLHFNTYEFYHLVSQRLRTSLSKANKCLRSWIITGCLWPVKLDTCCFVNDLATLRWLWDSRRSLTVWEVAHISALMRNMFFFKVM